MAILMKKIVVIVTLSIVSLFVFFLIDGFIAMFSQSGRGIILKANRFSYEYSALTGIALDLLEKEFGERIEYDKQKSYVKSRGIEKSVKFQINHVNEVNVYTCNIHGRSVLAVSLPNYHGNQGNTVFVVAIIKKYLDDYYRNKQNDVIWHVLVTKTNKKDDILSYYYTTIESKHMVFPGDIFQNNIVYSEYTETEREKLIEFMMALPSSKRESEL